MMPVRLEPVTSQSQVKHSTTEPLRSRVTVCDLIANLHCNYSKSSLTSRALDSSIVRQVETMVQNRLFTLIVCVIISVIF